MSYLLGGLLPTCGLTWGLPITWQGGSGATWKTATAWSPAHVPTTGEAVALTFHSATSPTISMDFTYTGSTAPASLLIENTWNTGGARTTLDLAANASLQIQNTITLGSTGAGRITQNNSSTITTGALLLGDTATGTGTYSTSAGTLTVTGDLTVGRLGNGVVSQNGGNVTLGGNLLCGSGSAASGSYTLNSGILNVGGSEQIGLAGAGDFSQYGGTHTVSGSAGIKVGGTTATGSFDLESGSLTAPALEVAPGGIFTHLGGTLKIAVFHQNGGTVDGNLMNQGDFLYDGGSFTGRLYSQGNATFHQDFTAADGLSNIALTPLLIPAGRALNLQGTGLVNDGQLTLAGTLTTTDCFVGYLNNGTFTQNSGTHIVTSTSSDYTHHGLILGYTNGLTATYQLNGGSLQTAYETLADFSNTNASFLQTNGTHTISAALYLGSKVASAHGSLSLSGGLLTAGQVIVGDVGTGVVTQSGGTCNITTSLSIAAHTGSHGQYLLQGGQLSTGSLANNDTFQQSGGTSSLGGITGTGTVAVGAGATLTTTSIRQQALTVGGTVRLVGNAGALSVLDQFTVTGTGGLDLGQGNLLVHNGSLSDLRGALHTGWADGAWNGPGISSATAHDHPGYGLALIRGADYLMLHPDGRVSDQTVTVGDFLIQYGLLGDMNLDGRITMDDYLQLDAAYLFGTTNPTSLSGDLNCDGVVNYQDYAMIDLALLHQPATPTSASLLSLHAAWFGPAYLDQLTSLVPEPTSLALLLTGTGLLLSRRNRPK